MTRLFALLLLAAPALADDTPASQMARQHYQKATALFNLGEWTDAVAEYKEAYKALPQPVFLYNIAQSYRLGGDLPKAVFFYNSYAHNATDPVTKHEAELRARKLEAQLAKGAPPKTAETRSEPSAEPTAAAAPSPMPQQAAAEETPGPTWAGASERLGSMTDLIKKHRDQFRFCYDAWSRRHPNLDGHVKLVLMLAPDGTLQASEAHLQETNAPELERCIVAMSRQLTYPPAPNGKMTRFSYPFEFKYRK
jgi:tetratricopeptide (TPR) repeat protein